MDSRQEIKYSYLLSAVGVAIVAITAIYSSVRALLFRRTFPRGDFNATRQFAYNATRQMNLVNPAARFQFGLTNDLTILGVIIAVAGLIWLGMALKKSQKAPTN